MKTKLYCENRFAYDGVAFFLMDRDRDGKQVIANVVNYTDYDPAALHEASFTISREATQELMDNLWTCGFRPTEGAGSAGALAATQEHVKTLKDFATRLLKLVEEK